MTELDPVVGVILAGGPSTRMTELHKAARPLAGVPLLQRVIERFAPQVDRLLINLNEHLPGVSYGRYTLIADSGGERAGPLAGLVSAFEYLEAIGDKAPLVAVVPCDAPFLPPDLVSVLATALIEGNAAVACARWDGHPQPTFSLWRGETAPEVINRHRREGQGGFRALLPAFDTVFVDWPADEFTPFFNINTVGDLAKAEQMLASLA